MIVRFICPAKNLRLKVKKIITPNFLCKEVFGHRNFWGHFKVVDVESHTYNYAVKWSVGLDLAKVRNTNNRSRTKGVLNIDDQNKMFVFATKDTQATYLNLNSQ
jgi:hypothetical protein